MRWLSPRGGVVLLVVALPSSCFLLDTDERVVLVDTEDWLLERLWPKECWGGVSPVATRSTAGQEARLGRNFRYCAAFIISKHLQVDVNWEQCYY